MDIKDIIETTRIVTATVSLDDIKAVAISAVKRQAGIGGDAEVVTTEADADANGAVIVKIAVKQPQAAPQAAPQPVVAEAAPVLAVIASAGIPQG